jgi:16S rRNA (guanine527-N7)-methyltransferase
VRELERVLELLAEDHRSLTSVRAENAWAVHVTDSLAGLAVPELRAARAIADLGSGAGFPGFVLAAALPDARVDLIESVGRKADFSREAAEVAGIGNASTVNARSEDHAAPGAAGREAYDAVTARAVARLATLAELASPLLREEGVLVAWKAEVDPDEVAELDRAAEACAMEPERLIDVTELTGAQPRNFRAHLHVLRKTGPTPANLPRRPGMAKKRPLG